MRRSLFTAAAILSSIASAQYCIPQATGFNCASPTNDEFIANVTVSNLNNSSACGPVPGYENFTASVPAVSLLPGQTYNISVTIGKAWSSDRVYVMLDTNANQVFDTTVAGGELLATYGPLASGNGATSQTVSGNITIPACIMPATRLRVRLNWGAAAMAAGTHACATSTFGNTEDYAVDSTSGPLPDYQVNQGNAAHDFEGVIGSAFIPADVTRCANTNFAINVASPLVGNPYDVLVAPAPLLPRLGGAFFSGHQLVNVNLATFQFAFNNFASGFPGSFSIPGSLPVAFDVTTQFAILDPTNCDTVALSQPNTLHIVPNAGLAGYVAPQGDDSGNLLPQPSCIKFYGATRTQTWVTTNGHVGFGALPNNDFSPTVAEAAAGNPMVGYWTDLYVNYNGLGSNIAVTNPAPGLTRFQWNGVPYFGNYTALNTFGIEFDYNTNSVRIDNLAGIVAGTNPGGSFLGMSAGGGASTPAAVSYSPALSFGSGTAAPNPGMIYRFGTQGGGLAGLSGILYTWNSSTGNYDWVSY